MPGYIAAHSRDAQVVGSCRLHLVDVRSRIVAVSDHRNLQRAARRTVAMLSNNLVRFRALLARRRRRWFVMAMQRPHDANPRYHRWAAALGDQHQRMGLAKPAAIVAASAELHDLW
jgi:hypothetical protein